jgi:hypothetical protein
MSEELTDFERGLMLDMAWFAPDSLFAGQELRPLSLASRMAMGLMGLRLLDGDAELGVEDETKEVVAYIWLHHAPLDEVQRALWSGSWRLVLDGMDEPLPEVVAEFRVLRARLAAMLDAAEVVILPRPKGDADPLPARVVGPSEFAHRAAVVARCVGMPLGDVLWRLPLAQALQIYHAEMRWQGQLTARPAREVEEGVFDDFGIGDIDNPPVE